MKQVISKTSAADPRKCLAQADMLLWLAECLRMPSAETMPTRLQTCALAGETGLDRDHVLGRALWKIVQHAEATPVADHIAEHHRLFDGAMGCPPNETAYVRRDKGAILGDICGFYRAFGFTPREASGDKPDHVVAELEFVAMLLVMLAQAERANHAEAAQVTRDALHAFAQEHVDPWLALFAQRLADVAVLPFHVMLAEALEVAWEELMRGHAMPRAEQVQVGDPLSEPEDISKCGLAQALGGQEAVELRVSAPRTTHEPCVEP